MHMREVLHSRAGNTDDTTALGRIARLMVRDFRLLRFCSQRDNLARKSGFDPSQPRVPAGSSDGGQWTDGGASGRSFRWQTRLSRPQTQISEFSAARVRGHHFVPRSLFQRFGLSAEARKALDRGVTGRLRAEKHGWSVEHHEYNKAVREKLSRFLRDNKIRPESMTANEATEFRERILRDQDPRIRNFNLKIYRREILYWIRRIRRLD